MFQTTELKWWNFMPDYTDLLLNFIMQYNHKIYYESYEYLKIKIEKYKI